MLSRVGAAGIVCFIARAASPDQSMFKAIRANDIPLIERQISHGAGVNSRGQHDTTPLMYAAAFGSVECMKLLLAAGADVNAKNAFDATALMWSAGDLTRVQLLVEKGADVNAKSKQGRTPLMIAANHSGAEQVVRFLLANGADAKIRDTANTTALIAAAQANDAESVGLLLEQGVDANARDLSGGTALMFAAGNDNVAAVQLLLKARADVNAVSGMLGITVKAGLIALGKYTPLLIATTYGSPELVKTLLDAGADVNAKDVRGMTPLMMSVTSEYQRPEVVRLLLVRGADSEAKSLEGETAGDWAAKFAHPEVVSLFKSGATNSIVLVDSGSLKTTKSAATGLSNALSKSLALLQGTNPIFFRTGGCAGCHSQQLTAFALRAAKDRGVKFDEKAAAEQVRVIAADFVSQDNTLLQRMDPPAGTMITSFNLMALSAMAYPPDGTTDAMVWNLASQQQTNGSWRGGSVTLSTNARAPMQDGDISTTSKDILALRDYGFPGRKAEFDQRVGRARKWLLNAVPRFNEDRTFQLLGLKWAGAAPDLISNLAKELLAEQRRDGGWGQNPYLCSDAYATGQTLYALNQAAGINTSDKAYQRGLDYLLTTQLADGSWHVRSRAVKFQPYFQSGFPHDHDQWISSAATAWSAAALATALPAITMVASQ
jgi:ankyrin repeat protein